MQKTITLDSRENKAISMKYQIRYSYSSSSDFKTLHNEKGHLWSYQNLEQLIGSSDRLDVEKPRAPFTLFKRKVLLKLAAHRKVYYDT